MLEVFPSPTEIINQQIKEGLTPGEAFGTDHGIYGMFPNDPLAFQASGHCDIFYPSTKIPGKGVCAANCYWDKTLAKIIYLWKLY